MRHIVLVSALLTSAAAIPAPAATMDDAVMLDPATPLARSLPRIADGSLRMITLAAPPPATPPPITPPPRLKDRPAPRPPIVVANSCDWPNPDTALTALRGSLTGPVWLLSPAAGCAPEAVNRAVQQASTAPHHDRLALLLASGLRLSALEAPPSPTEAPRAPAPVAGPGAAAPGPVAMAGKLVISALPPGAMLSGGAPAVIRAGIAPSAPTATAIPEANAAPAVAARAVPATMARRPGQPEPAIIVGELASLLGASRRSAIGTPRNVRDRIRQIDPAFFEMMLTEGRFDPDAGQYAAAIQTELLAMNCYTGTVDGTWGSGSLAALQRYFSTLGQAQAAATPGPALYRQIITRDSLRCPEPRAVAPRNETAPNRATGTASRNSAAARNTTTRSSGTTPAAAPRQVTPQNRQTQPPARTAPTAPRIDPNLLNSLGSGVIK